MWKCPRCSQKNRINVCSKCGYENSRETKNSISSYSFILMAILSVALIIGIIFSIDFFIDLKHRQRAKHYEDFAYETEFSTEESK